MRHNEITEKVIPMIFFVHTDTRGHRQVNKAIRKFLRISRRWVSKSWTGITKYLTNPLINMYVCAPYFDCTQPNVFDYCGCISST